MTYSSRTSERVAALHRLGLLDPASEEAFDRLTRATSIALHVPITLVTLVDENRQFFKSQVGLPEPVATTRETPLSHSLCKYVAESGEPLVVEDAREHPLLRDHPATRELGVVAYAGMPVHTDDGVVLGTLCAIDNRPHSWTEEEIDLLGEMAEVVSSQVEARVASARHRKEEDDLAATMEQQASVLEERLEELQNQAAQLEESHAELETAYEALRERDEQFALISENIREVFWIFNPDFSETIYISPAYEKLWGRSVASVYRDADSFLEAVHPDDRESLAAAMRILRETPSEGISYRIVRPDGQVRWAWSRGYPVRDANGQVYRVVGTTEDITEERVREEELRLLAGALEGLDEGVSVMRFDGRLVYANSTHRRLLGYDEVGKLPNVREVLPDEATMRQLDEAFRSVAERGAWAGRSRRRRLSDGRIIPVEMILGRVDSEDGESLVFNIIRDLTEEIAREDQLRRVERLASVGTLIGGVAHELNNPLHAIRNFAELMLLDERGEEDREALEIIRREADRAAKVVSDLRIFARQTQEEPGEHGEVDLNDVVRHVLKLRQYAMTTRDIELVEELSPDLPPVWGNQGEMEQVALNLVVNAEQALATHGGPRRLIVRTLSTDKGAVLQVVDNGPGIPTSDLERIFDPFFTTKAPGEGTGLGLSLVYGIVQEHGGEIRVESEPGKGATFTVALRGAPASAKRAAEAEESAPLPIRRSLRILVVDDEPSVRRSAMRYFTRIGHHVDAAAEGAEALRLLDGAPYDVIISDLRMPGLDGEALLQRLRERGEGLERRVIFLTGDAASAQAARVLAGSGVPVLVKPVRLAAVARVAQEVADAAEEVDLDR